MGNMLFNRYLGKESEVKEAFTAKDKARFQALQDYFTRYGQQ